METFVKTLGVVFAVGGGTMIFIGGGMVLAGAAPVSNAVSGGVLFFVGLASLLLSLLLSSLADKL